eukprot:5342097-Pyramimonas_sp.AAC.1
MARVAASVEDRVVGKRPRASFDAVLSMVLGVARVIAAVNHASKDQGSQASVVFGDFTRDVAVDVVWRGQWVDNSQSNVALRKSSKLAFNHFDEVPAGPAKRLLSSRRQYCSGLRPVPPIRVAR